MLTNVRMKAAVYTEYGPPSVLSIKSRPKPSPGAHEVLICVHATTVNRTDCAILSAKPFIMRFFMGLFRPSKQIPGTAFAGVIESVGKDVGSFSVGQRVFGFDDGGVSAQAEYMIISEKKALTTIPDNVSYAEAAASIEGSHYAYNFINKIDLKAGQKILVNGATGAIGSAAVQLLRYCGASVVAVGDTKNLALLSSLGAERVIDYTKEDFTRENQQYDFIFDAVGKSSFGKCKRLLPAGGAYVSSELGVGAQNIFFALSTQILGSKKVIIPVPTDTIGSLMLTRKLLEEGKFKAVIDKKYPLEKIAEAYGYVQMGMKTGNVVISLGED